MKLHHVKPGTRAKITAMVGGDKSYRQRLMAMGLLPGTEIRLSRIAPLGDPIEIEVRGVSLTLRKQEASILELDLIEVTA